MEREKFGSRLGFILISAGCAIGLGNVWRFPYIVGKYGGAAFVLIYLAFLLILGLPVMVAEFAVGRASQIRVHMNHIGHPLPGDYLYNPDYRLIKRQALHSCRLTFCHPISGKPMDFTAPIPDDFKTFACGCVELHQYADNG